MIDAPVVDVQNVYNDLEYGNKPSSRKKTRLVPKYTVDAVDMAKGLTKDAYKNIKHMDKVALVSYLHQLYQAGWKNGYQAGMKKAIEDGTGHD